MTRSLAELRQYLAGEWLFDNDFKDTSGNDNDGTPTDIEWKPTLRGMKPYSISSSQINGFGKPSELQLGVNDATFSAWINVKDIGTHQGIVGFGATGTTDEGYYFAYENDSKKIFFWISNGTSRLHAASNVVSITDEKYHHITAAVDRSSNVNFYLDGVSIGTYNISSFNNENIQSTVNNFVIRAQKEDNVFPLRGYIDDTKVYIGTFFTATEVLNLYNETKGEYGVMPAEHSFTHNPDDVIDASSAVGAWGTAKESTIQLVDLSGNGNIATIHGAMPTEGFIQGRRFDGINDYIDCGNDSSLDITDVLTIRILFSMNTLPSVRGIHNWLSSKGLTTFLWVSDTNDKIYGVVYNGGVQVITSEPSSALSINIIYYAKLTFDGNNLNLYVDGILVGTVAYTGAIDSSLAANQLIGTFTTEYTDIYIYTYMIDNDVLTTHNDFNTLARLPFWSVNYTDYPDNVTEYTDNLPYSSSIINSGTFKVDDDKLQCVSAGTMTYSASYNFDGSEYIKVEIGGVEYAGTGTITQGNTTVSVAQGSNKVTVVMGTGDTIDGIDIQFREEV